MKKLYSILTVLFIAAAVQISGAQTTIDSNVTVNTTWTKAKSPYHITGSIYINSGVVLTIEPGVKVLVDSTFQIFVNGELNAHGTNNDSISFSGSSPSAWRQYWAGIAADPGKVSLRFVQVRNAFTGVVTGQNSEIKFSRIELCYKGVSAKFKNLIIENNTFNFNRTGLDIIGSGDFRFNLFSNNTQWGVYGTSLDSIYDCGFQANNFGVSGKAYLKECMLLYNNVAVDGQEVSLSCNQIITNIVGIQNVLMADSSNKICSNMFNAVYTLAANHSLPNVCWCETDSASIAAKITDGNDNSAYGKLNFMPVRNCDNNTTMDILCGTQTIDIEQSTAVEYSIYPNPSDGKIVLNSTVLLHDAEIQVFNTMGELIFNLKGLNGYLLDIDAASLRSGIYFIKLSQGADMLMTERLLIVK